MRDFYNSFESFFNVIYTIKSNLVYFFLARKLVAGLSNYTRVNYLIALEAVRDVPSDRYEFASAEIIHPDPDLIAVCNACVNVQEKVRRSMAELYC